MVDKHVVAAVLVGLAIGFIGGSPPRVAYLADLLHTEYGSRPEPNYDECLLDAMRGQQQIVFPSAEKVCSRKAGRIQDVPWAKNLLDFSVADARVRVTAQSAEYDIVEGSFRIASKKCDQAQDNDFGQDIDVTATVPNQFGFGLTAAQAASATAGEICFRSGNLKGRYK